MFSFRNPLLHHPSRSRPASRKRSPLRVLERLEERTTPTLSVTNLALSGGAIPEGSAAVRTLSGALAGPAISAVDLAITWGDGSAVQHVGVAAGVQKLQIDHTVLFP